MIALYAFAIITALALALAIPLLAFGPACIRRAVEDARAANRERNPERCGALDAKTAAGIGVGVTHFGKGI